jgi:predicted regulator of Ras-like GTPase activity (Roadblock/LC7/MglB family)
VEQMLSDLLRYEEVLGAVVFSGEGLPLASAGVADADAELVGALGASMLGAVDRTSRRIGVGPVESVAMAASEGMIHLWCGDDLAVALFTETCHSPTIDSLGREVLHRAASLLGPLAS